MEVLQMRDIVAGTNKNMNRIVKMNIKMMMEMKMMEMNPFFEKMDFKSQFEQMPYHDFLYDELVQDKEYKSKLTLCIDIMNVFLAKIDLNDQRDLEQFKNC